MVQQRAFRYSPLFFMLFLITACSAVPISPPITPSALDPHGTAAAHIASLWWVMLAFATAIFVLVLGLIFAALLRHRRATMDTPPETRDGDTGRNWLIRGGIILPLIVLAIVFGYTIYTLAVIENPQAQAALHIRVTARRWWWQVNYPDRDVTTANEIHIPVGVPVQFALESEDVIHSFWIPQLHGKMDVIPPLTNYITLQADQAGIYRGECAEFCGLQHATMGFMVVAQSSDDFEKWLAAQHQPVATPTDLTAKQGQQVFISAGCVFCHTVQGLDEQSIVAGSIDLGPDLTHLSSRLTIVGASLTNNKGNLAGWIMDAQHIKEGSDMPRISLNSRDLQSLLAYLETLQ
jgi:cytochrome c oxidase subunit 2